jgi:dTDP-4-amino-4,6-dideoxygalactose transaminase
MATILSKASDSSAPLTTRPELPFLNLQAQYTSIREEIRAAVDAVFESQHFILGEEVAQFEQEFAEFVGCRYAVSCASGSDALLLALLALKVGAGDEVVTTAFTFGATVGAILRTGARVRFVDIDPATFNLNVSQLESAVSPNTKALMPVHLFGLCAAMGDVMNIARRHGLWVVEDAAQAIGARCQGMLAGAIGDVGCFSFFPSKNLGGAGDGGMLTTNDAEVAERARVLRVHGCRSKYRYELLGFNSRLDALQAAILRVKLRHLLKWTAARQHNAARYRDLFAEKDLPESATPVAAPGYGHVYNQFVIRVARRDELREALRRQGIPTEIYYPEPLHLQPAFQGLGYGRGDLPQAELAAKQVLALPIYPELSDSDLHRVVDAVADFYAPSTSEQMQSLRRSE